jgi:hypothetical protein
MAMANGSLSPDFRLEYLILLQIGINFEQSINNFCQAFLLKVEETEPGYISGSGNDFSFRAKLVYSNTSTTSNAVFMFVEAEDEYSLQTAKEIIEEKFGTVFSEAILLTDSISQDRTVEAYKLINELENTLRKLIALRLSSLSAQDWWNNRIRLCLQPRNGRYKYEDYRDNEITDTEITPPNEQRHHDLFYLDLSELKKVIEEQNNWQDGFASDLKVLKNIERLDMLNRLRRKIAHNRNLSQRNLDDLKQIHGQLMYLCRRVLEI